MKRSSYMSREELLQYLKIGVLASECKAIAENTPDKDWHKRLMMACSLLAKVVDDRAKCLDREQLLSVARRHKNTKVILQTEDKVRFDKAEKEVVLVDIADLDELAYYAIDNKCGKCKQGDCVKGCEFRMMLHRLGLQVARDEVKSGQCEWRIE